MYWRRKWQPIPVFLPGESQGWEAWWAAVYGVAQSRTRLKRLSSSSSSSMDLRFQVPMQHCSLQHRTLLPSPVTSTTGCWFGFGAISSFFRELFLHSSPVVHWAPTDLRSSSVSVMSFCLFILFILSRKMVEGAKSHLKSNPMPTRDAQRVQTNSCVHQDPETPQRLSQNSVRVCPVEVWVTSGLPRGQGLWVWETGHTACGISPLGGGLH